MKNLTIVGVLMLGIGFAIGWIAKPVPAVKTELVAPRPAAAKPSGAVATTASSEAPPAGKHAIREPEAKNSDKRPNNEEIQKQAKKMQADMSKAMVKRTREKYERMIERLNESLHLTPEQKARLTAWLDEKSKNLEELDFSNPKSFSGMSDLSKMLTEKGLAEQLEPSLDPGQKELFAEFKEAEHQKKVDTAALKSLSKLQGVIEFGEGQRDEVYKVLTESAEAGVNAESEKPDFARMFTEGMGIEMDPYDLGLTQAMTESMGDPSKVEGAHDPKEMMKHLREVIDKRIDEKVERLRPVLNDKQLELYRSELKTKGLGVYGPMMMGQESE